MNDKTEESAMTDGEITENASNQRETCDPPGASPQKDRPPLLDIATSNKETTETESLETTESPTSITVTRYQLCLVLSNVVELVQEAVLTGSNHYDCSVLEALVPLLDKDGNRIPGEEITLTRLRLQSIVLDVVQSTRRAVANKMTLPTGITIDGLGPDGSALHLSWNEHERVEL